jgi:predicted SAM-dependent methyltransferase
MQAGIIFPKSRGQGSRKLFSLIRFLLRVPMSNSITIPETILQNLTPFAAPYKLHVGCGGVKFEGWVNVDANSSVADISWDLTCGIPCPDHSCELIYHEHFLEHLSVEAAVAFLQECYRALQPGGIMRIAMPDLQYVIEKYSSENWQDQDWLTWEDYRFIKTRAEMLNIALRWWGHQWLYDREELHRRLTEAGFNQIDDVTWRESTTPALKNLETRKDSVLICEARKPS